jgi:hypothetical protein
MYTVIKELPYYLQTNEYVPLQHKGELCNLQYTAW